ncbi:hypothetical protein NPIL_355761, partial [Nephila pilipes]
MDALFVYINPEAGLTTEYNVMPVS